jgi:putative transposase
MPFYDRKTPRLRIGRISSADAKYFITLCTKNRTPVLTQKESGSRVNATLQSMHDSGDMELIAATAMPDHVHILFGLGNRLKLGQVIGKFKTKSRNQGLADWLWQEDGFEHRLRSEDAIEDYGFYIFMNPYRARICPLERRWEWWLCPNPTNLRFLSLLAPEEPVPKEWLGLCEEIAAKITIRGL